MCIVYMYVYSVCRPVCIHFIPYVFYIVLSMYVYISHVYIVYVFICYIQCYIAGRVCIPIDPKAAEEFDPFSVPTLRVLCEEVSYAYVMCVYLMYTCMCAYDYMCEGMIICVCIYVYISILYV